MEPKELIYNVYKEYHIHLNIPPKDNQENPFVNHINIKEINYHHNQITSP